MLSCTVIFSLFTNITYAESSTDSQTDIDTNSVYVVLPGDTLWSIAENLYGSGIYYLKVALFNNLSNPRLIHRGNILKLPAIPNSQNSGLRCDNPTEGLRDATCIKSIEDIYTGYEFNLPQLSPGNPVRLQVEELLTASIRKAIEDARGGNKQQAQLLLSSMEEKKLNHNGPTFSSWMGRWGRIIGKEECYELGMKVTSDMKFTTEEANNIIE